MSSIETDEDELLVCEKPLEISFGIGPIVAAMVTFVWDGSVMVL